MTYPRLDKVPPHDADAERSLLGCAILDPHEIDKLIPRPTADDFYLPHCRLLWQAIESVVAAGHGLDTITIWDAVKEMHAESDVTLSDLASCFSPSAVLAQDYWRIIRRHSQHRKAIIHASERLKMIFEANGNLSAILMERCQADADFISTLDDPDSGRPRITPISGIIAMSTSAPLAEPVIDGLLRRGEVGTFVSGTKAHKSHTVMDLGLSIVTGEPWLSFPCRQGKVLLLDFELAPETWYHRLSAICRARGIEPRDGFDVQFFRGQTGVDLDYLSQALRLIQPGHYDLIILDPLYKIYPTKMDENSNADMARVYEHLFHWAKRSDSALMVIHHTSKGDQADKAITDMGAGAGTQSRASDVHIGMKLHREHGCMVFDAVPRSFAPIIPVVVRWDYPRWSMTDLDPEDVYRQSERRQKSPPTIDQPPKQRQWTSEDFAQSFCGPNPKAKVQILHAACQTGMSRTAADNLFGLALADQQLFEHGGKPFKYSTETPDLLEDQP